jgi:hypothetical protein
MGTVFDLVASSAKDAVVPADTKADSISSRVLCGAVCLPTVLFNVLPPMLLVVATTGLLCRNYCTAGATDAGTLLRYDNDDVRAVVAMLLLQEWSRIELAEERIAGRDGREKKCSDVITQQPEFNELLNAADALLTDKDPRIVMYVLAAGKLYMLLCSLIKFSLPCF